MYLSFSPVVLQYTEYIIGGLTLGSYCNSTPEFLVVLSNSGIIRYLLLVLDNFPRIPPSHIYIIFNSLKV